MQMGNRTEQALTACKLAQGKGRQSQGLCSSKAHAGRKPTSATQQASPHLGQVIAADVADVAGDVQEAQRRDLQP